VRVDTADVLVIGSGPAGLTTATRLRRLGVDEVVVLEREGDVGGIPRHSAHPSFGLRDYGRPMTGPRYVAALVRGAERESVVIRTGTTVTGLGYTGKPYLTTQSAEGQTRWEADAIVLATGCRERPRSARLIPGTRAPGVFTTGELQQFTYLRGVKVGSRAVVVGAEHVSFSAVMTLRDAGIDCVAVITPFSAHQSYSPLRLWATRFGRVPLLTGHRLVGIEGRRRVDGVVVEGPDGRRGIDCDTVILTGEWVAEGSLALAAGLRADKRNGGRPSATAGGTTSLPGIYAAGSVVKPGESAASATRSGRTVAEAVANQLSRPPGLDTTPGLSMEWESPIRWVSPQRASSRRPVPLELRVDQWVTDSTVVFRTDGTVLDTVSVRRLVPGRTYTFDGAWMGRVEEDGARVQVSIGVRS
jgi:thioredoxin reductase